MPDFEYIHHLLYDDPNISTAAAATIAFVLSRTGGNPLVPSASFPLISSGDECFEPDGVLNDALCVTNDTPATSSGDGVNGLNINGGAHTLPVTLNAIGADPDVGMAFTTAGAGQFEFSMNGSGFNFIGTGAGNSSIAGASSILTLSFGGVILLGVTAAPADGDIPTSGVALWLDDTPGSTSLNIKAKDSGGTVRTATIALT